MSDKPIRSQRELEKENDELRAEVERLRNQVHDLFDQLSKKDAIIMEIQSGSEF